MTARQGALALAAVLLCLAAPLPAAAGGGDADAVLCENAIVTGARTGGVPQEVLHAISLTETGRPRGGSLRPWPWAVNLEGQGHWFGSREEALAFARHSLAEGRRSFDVGCFQINYKYHGHNFPSLEAMFEPATAADYAARFLGDLFMESGDWSVAAGAYHSRTPHFARIYRARFDRIFSTVAGTPLVTAQAAQPEPGAAPRPSRTRMTRGPLIIRIERRPEEAAPHTRGGRMARLETKRVEKALPGQLVADDVRVAVRPAGPPAGLPAARPDGQSTLALVSALRPEGPATGLPAAPAAVPVHVAVRPAGMASGLPAARAAASVPPILLSAVRPAGPVAGLPKARAAAPVLVAVRPEGVAAGLPGADRASEADGAEWQPASGVRSGRR